MVCLSPFYLPGHVAVPCGHCLPCRIQRVREWAIRCMHEASLYKNNCFVTLTYNDYYLPVRNTVEKEALQRFIKRFRKSVEPRKIRYFACGEYGEERQRPHYHLILFNVGLSDFVKLPGRNKFYKHPSWTFGHIYIDECNYNTARYVAGYLFKSFNGDDFQQNIYHNTFRENPFSIKSQGIGKEWCLRHADTLKKDLCIYAQGKKCRLPRYYRELLDINSTYYEELLMKNWNDLKSRFQDIDPQDIEDKLFERMGNFKRDWQRLKNIKARSGKGDLL